MDLPILQGTPQTDTYREFDLLPVRSWVPKELQGVCVPLPMIQ